MKKLEEIVKKLETITPGRRRIAKIFKTHVEKAVDELGPGCMVDLQGDFFATPIRITIEISRPNRRSLFNRVFMSLKCLPHHRNNTKTK